jgi:predicted DCC family thiol-disulfide oxidoreductase YuxK
MATSEAEVDSAAAIPILLFDGQCTPCRRLAAWVQASAGGEGSGATVSVRPIGEDPEALRALNPGLDIWEAYATSHLVMTDGSMKTGGEAVAEVLRRLPNCAWFSWLFALHVLGLRPFQGMLDAAFVVLAHARPILGCESCGTPSVWIRPIVWLMKLTASISGGESAPPLRRPSPHFTQQRVPAVPPSVDSEGRTVANRQLQGQRPK